MCASECLCVWLRAGGSLFPAHAARTVQVRPELRAPLCAARCQTASLGNSTVSQRQGQGLGDGGAWRVFVICVFSLLFEEQKGILTHSDCKILITSFNWCQELMRKISV